GSETIPLRGPCGRQACGTRAARGSIWRALRSSRQELADHRARTKSMMESRARDRRKPQQSAERRAGRRNRPVIFGDPKIGPLARRTTGCGVSASAPVGALLPSFFSAAETDEGHPAPSYKPDGGALACRTLATDRNLKT